MRLAVSELVGKLRGVEIFAANGNDRFFRSLGKFPESPPFVVNPFGFQIPAVGAKNDQHLRRCQRVINIRLVVVSLDVVQGFTAEKDIVLTRKLVVDRISEVSVVRTRILEADEDLTSLRALLADLAVFFLVFLDQLCQLFIIFTVSAEFAVLQRLFIGFRFLTRLIVDIPEGRDRFARIVLIKDHVLLAQKTAPIRLFHANTGFVFCDQIVVASARLVKIRLLPFVNGVRQVGVDRLVLQIPPVLIAAALTFHVISTFQPLSRSAGGTLKIQVQIIHMLHPN